MVDEVRDSWKISIRRARSVLGLERSSYHYKSRRPDQDALRARIKKIAGRGCAPATGVFMSCCGGKDGWSTGCIARWACSYATNRPLTPSPAELTGTSLIGNADNLPYALCYGFVPDDALKLEMLRR